MTVQELRSQFPILERKVYGRQLVYLDNAATSQRPVSVVKKWEQMSLESNANIHRAVHKLASDATDEYESTRKAVAEFIGAASEKEIVFTSGATHSINLVASSFGEKFIGEGDEIIICESEHHSNIVPWQILSQRKGCVIKVLPVNDDGSVAIEKIESLITPRTKLLAMAQISNVLGLVNPVEETIQIAHSQGVAVLIDGAQGIIHCAVDVQKMDCDFYVFSGHKLYAAPGTGVLYAKAKWLEEMPPYMGGGEMIESVSFKKTTYNSVPYKFEAGTQNLAGVPTLKEAIKLANLLNDKDIEKEQRRILDYVTDSLLSIEGLRLYGFAPGKAQKINLFSFSIDGIHHEDLAHIMDKMGVAVRSGQMCAEPLMDRMGVSGMLRASFAAYNTLEEAEIFIKSLYTAINMLK